MTGWRKRQIGEHMTKDEALVLALEALEGVLDDFPKVLDASISGGLYEVVQCRDAITAIKAALEAKDEPVAYMSHNKENFVSADDVGNSVPNWTDYYPTPLYATPPPCPTCIALSRTVMMDQTGRDA